MKKMKISLPVVLTTIFVFGFGIFSGMPAMAATTISRRPLDLNATETATEAGTPTVTETSTQILTATPTLTASSTPAVSRTPTVTTTPTSVPGANFVGAPTSGSAPLTVQFTALDRSVLSNCEWNFGDGSTQSFLAASGSYYSFCPSTSHVYATAGNFTVSLTVKKVTGASNTLSKTNYIQVVTDTVTPTTTNTPTITPSSVPGVDFMGGPTSGSAPLTVQFTSLSSGGLSSCTWNYGDGSGETFYPPAGQSAFWCPSPSHIYTFAGNFNVSLQVVKYSSGSSAIKTKINYVQVNDFTPTPSNTPTRTPTPTPTPLLKTFRSVPVEDGWILELSEGSYRGGIVNSSASTLQLGDDPENRQYRAILSFNTGSLPDNAVIQSAILSIKHSGAVVGSNPFSVFGKLRVDICTGFFGASGLQPEDFQRASSAGNVGAFNPKPALSWYSASLNAVGLSKINRVGPTQLRLHFDLADNNNYLADLIKFFSGDSLTDRPTLVINYSLP